MLTKISTACGLILIALLAACQEAAPPATSKRTVLVHSAAPAPASDGLLNGEIRARHEADLAFRVGGKLLQRQVDLGQAVEAGQPLARLDPEDLRLAAVAARAQLVAAESELLTAQAEQQRHADLLARKFISQAAFDAKQHAWRSAQSRLEQAKAQLAVAENQQQYATLSSPFAGVVTAINAEAGQVVGAGQPVLRVARPEEKEVLVAVPENRRDEVKAAQRLTVHLWAEPKTVLRGTLRELAASADPTTRTYSARIRLLDPPPGLALGLSARVSMGGAASQILQVPLAAIFDRGQGPSVWTVREGQVELRPVRVAALREDGALIADGLSEGELVVAAGVQHLAPGQAVAMRRLPPPAEQR